MPPVKPITRRELVHYLKKILTIKNSYEKNTKPNTTRMSKHK